ncbi:MAG: aldo/keto reductase, partial [Clostridia bacterium]|nr:aldo/keto reductase [Clostridia bacterium]
SEVILGDYFSRNKQAASSAQITTKIRLDMPTGTPGSDIRDAVMRYVETGLERLKMDKVHNLMLHSPDDLFDHEDKLVKALEQVKAQGLAANIGVSANFPKETEKMLEYNLFTCIQMPFNILDTRNISNGMLKRLHQKGVYVYTRSVFMQGLYFMDLNSLVGNLNEAKPFLKRLRQACEDNNMSMAELAFGYARDMDEIDSLVVGADEPAHIEQNIKLLNGPSLPQDIKQELFEYFKQVPEFLLFPRYWDTDPSKSGKK